MLLFLHMVPSFVEVFEFNTGVTAGEALATTAKLQACNMLQKMYELQALVEELKCTPSGEHMGVAKLFNTDLVRSWSVITAFLSGREGTGSEVIRDVPESFPVQSFFDVLCRLQMVHVISLTSCSICDLSFCLGVINVADIVLLFDFGLSVTLFYRATVV